MQGEMNENLNSQTNQEVDEGIVRQEVDVDSQETQVPAADVAQANPSAETAPAQTVEGLCADPDGGEWELLYAQSGKVHSAVKRPSSTDWIDERGLIRAGFWPRLAARLMDGWLTNLLVGVLLLVLQLMGVSIPSGGWLVLLLGVIIGVAYRTLTTLRWGGTLGKMAMELEVVSREGAPTLTWWPILFRESIGRFLADLLMVGYFSVFGRTHTALHDYLSDTCVVYRNAQRAMR